MNTSRRLRLLLLTIASVAFAGGVVIANPPASLTVFQAGEPIRAAELNANLTFLQNKIAALEQRATSAEGRLSQEENSTWRDFGGAPSTSNGVWTTVDGLGFTIPLKAADMGRVLEFNISGNVVSDGSACLWRVNVNGKIVGDGPNHAGTSLPGGAIFPYHLMFHIEVGASYGSVGPLFTAGANVVTVDIVKASPASQYCSVSGNYLRARLTNP